MAEARAGGAGVTSSLLVCRICFLLQTCSSAAATKSSTAADPTLLISVVRRVCEMCRVSRSVACFAGGLSFPLVASARYWKQGSCLHPVSFRNKGLHARSGLVTNCQKCSALLKRGLSLFVASNVLYV